MTMAKPVLMVLAAGMGSRYGGLKQLDAVGPDGEILMDYSVYDAIKAGFGEIVFIIREEFAEAFRALMAPKLDSLVNWRCVFQDADDLPEGYKRPANRERPWGTGHAVLAARDVLRGPFAVINADDYYGKESYRLMYDFLSTKRDDDKKPLYGMCTWRLRRTLSEYGEVSRGVLTLDEEGRFAGIREIKKIERTEDGGRFSTDEGKTWNNLDGDRLVSMNFWGFPLSFIELLREGFPTFLNREETQCNMRAEYLLPEIVGDAYVNGKADVHLMPVQDRWFGVTFREDQARVANALSQFAEDGVYPRPLFDTSIK